MVAIEFKVRDILFERNTTSGEVHRRVDVEQNGLWRSCCDYGSRDPVVSKACGENSVYEPSQILYNIAGTRHQLRSQTRDGKNECAHAKHLDSQNSLLR